MMFELKKLFAFRFFRIFWVFILVGNGVLAYTEAPDDRAWNYALEQCFEEYQASPEAYDQRYQNYLDAKEMAVDLQMEALVKGEDPMQYTFAEPMTLSPDSGYTDGELFAALYERIGYPEAYRSRLEEVLQTTEENLLVVTDPYMRSYLQEVRNAYRSMLGLQVSSGQTGGWEFFFGYRGTGILLLLALLPVTMLLASVDREGETETFLFATFGGFRRILRQKFLALGIFCTVGSLLMEGVAFLGFAAENTFHGGTAFLASLEGYALCPYPVYVYEFALLRVFLRVLVLITFGMLLLLLARVLTNRFLFLLAGAGFVGLQAFWNTGGVGTLGSLTGSINLFRLLEADSIFRKYVSVNLFGTSVSMPVAFGGVLTLVALLCSVLLFLQWKRRVRQPRRLPSIQLPTIIPRTLWGFEAKKLFFRGGLLIPILLLVGCKLLLPVSSMTYREQLYAAYMEHLEGELTEEKEQYLLSERSRFETLFAKEAEYDLLYRQGEISYGELSAVRMEVRTARLKFGAFEEAEAQVARIRALNQEGIPGELLYAKGWELFLEGDVDILLLLLLMLPSFAYAVEDRKRFRSVLCSTPGGIGRTLGIKIGLCALATTVGSVLIACIDLWKIGAAHSLPLPQALAVSMNAGGSDTVSLWASAILLIACRALICALLSAVAVLLSYRLRNTVLCSVLWGSVLLFIWCLL